MAWFETWFDTPYYHILYKDRDFAEAENFITLLINHLNIPKDSKIIDLACGKGRHSVYLNKMGFDVLGLDLSPSSIAHNRKFENATLKFKVHDMREEISPEVSAGKVEAVLNLFTSFGYFENEDDDRKVFRSLKHVLKNNGYFVLDFLNERRVRNTLVPDYITTKGGIDFHIKKSIAEGNVIKDITFTDKGREYHFFEKVKLHTLEMITKYGEEFGFKSVEIFGDYSLGEFDVETSPRCITIFRKEANKI